LGPLHFLAIAAIERTIDVQATLLNFLGQQAIAHAATIFATLLAAFTLAEAVGKREGSSTVQKEPSPSLGTFYVFMLNVLFGIAIYAVFRLIYYGILWGLVLNNNPLEMPLTCYWQRVSTLLAEGAPTALSFYARLFVQLQLYLTIPSVLISWALGFVTAVGVAEYCAGEKRGWFAAFRSVQLRLKGLGVWALAAYFVYVTGLRYAGPFLSKYGILGNLVQGLILVAGGFVLEMFALFLLWHIRKRLPGPLSRFHRLWAELADRIRHWFPDG
jgi:hypothetical protein